jgi:RNA polymerase sigma factor (sigma-70 family)
VTHDDQRTPFGGSDPYEDLADLVSKAAAGDQAAWNTIVGRFAGQVWVVCRSYRLSQADAADAFQQTWLRVLEHLDSVRDPARLGSWIKTTCKREVLATLRRAKRAQPVGDPEVLDRAADPDANPDEPVLLAAGNAELWTAFHRLNSRCQEVLRVLVVEADNGRPSYEDASAALGIPIGSLGPTRARCLDRLRRFLTDGIGDADGAS